RPAENDSGELGSQDSSDNMDDCSGEKSENDHENEDYETMRSGQNNRNGYQQSYVGEACPSISSQKCPNKERQQSHEQVSGRGSPNRENHELRCKAVE